MGLFRNKEKRQTLAQAAAKFVLTRTTRKLSKKDLEIGIDGYTFHFEDMPLKKG